MKKKIFSKLLMGAVLVASISSFVSCKDYDDDISNLQSQIDKAALAADVKALDQKLTAAAAAAKEAADKAEADAQKAQSTADNAATKAALEQAIKDINAAAEAAGKQVAADIKKVADDAAAAYAVKATEGVAAQGVADAAAAKAAADAAQKAADEAAAAAKKAQETADANNASKADVEAAQAAAVAAADAAVKAANYATKSEVEAAQAAATAAADANADAKIAAALAEIVTKYGLEEQDIKGKLSYIASFQKEFASASALKTQINGLQSEIDAVKTMGGMAEAVAKIQSYDASVSELYSAVTSVELYYKDDWATYSGTANSFATRDVKFTQTIEKANVFPATPIEGEKQFVFHQDSVVTYGDSIVLRVSPVNAVLEKNMIQLINSKGENLDDYVEIVNVRPYGVTDAELLTRAGANNGLWLVELNLKKEVKIEDMKKVTKVYKEDGTPKWDEDANPGINDIRYAVKVNNTQKNAADRGVISAYDLCMDEDYARYVYDFSIEPEKKTDENVGPYNVADVYNRYLRCEDTAIRTNKVAEKVWPIALNPETNRYEFVVSTDPDQGVNRPDVAENPWADALVKGFTYKGLQLLDETFYNDGWQTIFADSDYVDYAYWNGSDPVSINANKLIDNRQGMKRISVDVNEEITIEFPSYNRIKGFYVTLDNDFALESKPSELEAWNSYSYKNVGTKNQPAYLFKGNKGTIKVTSEAARGDVIGFRVYAVHLDGTLYDPDGRAFYISIHSKKAEVNSMILGGVTPSIVGYYHGDDTAPYVTDFIELDQTLFKDLVNSSSPWHFTGWENDKNNKDKIGLPGDKVGEETGWSKTYLGKAGIRPYQVYFYDEDKNYLTNTVGWFTRDNIARAKYIKISVLYNDFIYYMDDETYKQSIKAQDDRTQIVLAEFSVEFTKTMPKMPVKWADFQYASQISSGVYRFYPMAAGDNYDALTNLTTGVWTTYAAPNNYWMASVGTSVGIDMDHVFDKVYTTGIDSNGDGVNDFTYTPKNSFSTSSGAGFEESLTLPCYFKMYIDGALWDGVNNKWVTDIYYFGTNNFAAIDPALVGGYPVALPNNRYNLVKSLGDGDEFKLINHKLAANAAKHATKITYTYPGISTRIDENNQWVVADNLEVEADDFKYSTCFIDPFSEPTINILKDGSNSYTFSTTYGKFPTKDQTAGGKGYELKFFQIKGQYLPTEPYVRTLADMLAKGTWRIKSMPRVVPISGSTSDGLIYYEIANAGATDAAKIADIIATGEIKLANKFTDESGRPFGVVKQQIEIDLVNILGQEWTFTRTFDMYDGR